MPIEVKHKYKEMSSFPRKQTPRTFKDFSETLAQNATVKLKSSSFKNNHNLSAGSNSHYNFEGELSPYIGANQSRTDKLMDMKTFIVSE